MRYHPQTDSACIAYALWQIDVVGQEEVHEYEQAIAPGLTWRNIGQWMQSYVPKYWDALTPIRTFNGPPNAMPVVPSPPEHGKGVLYLQVYDALDPLNVSWHAVSYDNGLVLDPNEKSPGWPETWEQLKERYMSSLLSPVIINAAEAT